MGKSLSIIKVCVFLNLCLILISAGCSVDPSSSIPSNNPASSNTSNGTELSSNFRELNLGGRLIYPTATLKPKAGGVSLDVTEFSKNKDRVSDIGMSMGA